MKVYNAFIMPFDSKDSKFKTSSNILHIGESVSNWKSSSKEYERIQGILIDTKYLMKKNVQQDEREIKHLSNLINECFKENDHK